MTAETYNWIIGLGATFIGFLIVLLGYLLKYLFSRQTTTNEQLAASIVALNTSLNNIDKALSVFTTRCDERHKVLDKMLDS